jgi:hypothetical protein
MKYGRSGYSLMASFPLSLPSHTALQPEFSLSRRLNISGLLVNHLQLLIIGFSSHGSCADPHTVGHASILRYEAYPGDRCPDYTLSVCLLMLANNSERRC